MPIFAVQRREAEARWPGLSGRKLINETVRRMIHLMVIDLLEQTRANIAAEGVARSPRSAAPRLVAYSDALLPRLRELKVFLRDKLYRHYQVLRMTNKARASSATCSPPSWTTPTSCRRSTRRWRARTSRAPSPTTSPA